MKLIHRVTIRLSILLGSILTVWSLMFYLAILDEINDEIDDSLETYSEQIMVRFLGGEEISSRNNNSNNQYYITEISSEYAQSRQHINYVDSMVYIEYMRETEPARVLTTIFRNEDGQYYELVVLTPTIEKADLKEAILYWTIFLYLGLLVVIILVNSWIYKRSYRPLHRLLAWIDKYEIGGHNLPLKNETDITEFQKLNEATLRYVQSAEKVFDEQKKFTGNASHEIQTPLAVALNRIENLMEDEALSENQLYELAKTYQTLESITKLNKSLLLLSQIDNRQFSHNQLFDCNAALQKIIVDYQEAYSYMRIRLILEENGLFKIKINDTLGMILINNLLKNSYLHNIENGSVYIEINSSSLVVKNTGCADALDASLIFERFYQSSRKEGSTGLGLAIVRSICDISNLHIHYYFEEGVHCFKLSL